MCEGRPGPGDLPKSYLSTRSERLEWRERSDGAERRWGGGAAAEEPERILLGGAPVEETERGEETDRGEGTAQTPLRGGPIGDEMLRVWFESVGGPPG